MQSTWQSCESERVSSDTQKEMAKSPELHLFVSCLLALVGWLSDFPLLEACPLDTNVTSCYCLYGDIICKDVGQIPRFEDDKLLYRSIDLSRQEIRVVPEGAFFHIKVKKITLDHNPINDRLNVNAFAGVEGALEELSLGNCGLPYLRQELLIAMKNLRRIYLWGNGFKEIPYGIFLGTPYLEELYLWGNNIEHLDENMFTGLSNLRRLDLDRNKIIEIRNNTFKRLPSLQVLHLGENQVFSLYKHTFRHLQKLKVLNLDKNRLTYVWPKAFHGLGRLVSLGLNNNQINFITDGTFKDLRNLKYLWLQNNKIDLLWGRTFMGLEELQKLHLSGNQIQNLPEGVFHHSSKLKHVILDNNKLETLRKCILSKRTRLKTLSVIGNPISCDCRMTWILDLTNRGVSIWGTCGTSAARAMMAVAHPENYDAASCPFSSADCM